MDATRSAIFAARIDCHLQGNRWELASAVLAEAIAEGRAGKEQSAPPNPRETSLSELGLPERTCAALDHYRHIIFAQQAIDASDDDLLSIPNVGAKTIAELRRTLHAAFSVPLSPRWAPVTGLDLDDYTVGCLRKADCSTALDVLKRNPEALRRAGIEDVEQLLAELRVRFPECP